jgi:hypothetical protein
MMHRTHPLTALIAVVALAVPARAQTEFFGPTRVHTITLTIEPTAWRAMEPARGGRGGGGPGMMGLDFPEVRASAAIDGKDYVVGLRFKGNSSYMMSSRGLKRPFKIDLNQFEKGQNIDGQTKLNLNNNVSDASQIREVLAYEMFRRLDVPASRTALAKVVLDVPGVHDQTVLGLYTLAEQVDSGWLKRRFGTSEGLLLKPEGARGGLPAFGDDWSRYEKVYDPKGKATDAQKARFMAFAQLVSGDDDAAFARKIGDYIDIDEFARFLAGTVVSTNMDSLLSMGHNFYIWQNPTTGKHLFLPWDLNMAFGGFPAGDAVRLSVRQPIAQHRLVTWFLALPAGRVAYEKACRDAARHLAALVPLYDTVSAVAAPIAALDPAGDTDGFAGGPGRGPGGPGGPELRPFLTQRAAAVLAQLDGKEEGVTARGGFPGGPGGPGGLAPGVGLRRIVGVDPNPTVADLTARWQRRVAGWDTNRDGVLSRVEVLVGSRAPLGDDDGPVRRLGGLLWDALNPPGPVSAAVYAGALLRSFSAWDTNRDGRLSDAEIDKGLRTRFPALADDGPGFGPPPGFPPEEGRDGR